MGKQNGSFEQWAKKGWGMVNGQLVNIKATNTQVKKEKIQKLPNLLERAQMQAIPDNKIIGEDSKPSKNAKVKNATKSVVDGVSFDSLLEKYMYNLLKSAGINFEFQKVYELQPKFKYNGEAIRAIKKIVDFWIPGCNMVVDTKGYSNDISPMKHKMLMWYFQLNGEQCPTIELPKNKKECDLLLNRILYDK